MLKQLLVHRSYDSTIPVLEGKSELTEDESARLKKQSWKMSARGWERSKRLVGRPAARRLSYARRRGGSHHGECEYGSPVLPRTPEAFALHYIDNFDAKLEMVRDAYAQSKEVAPGIFDRVFPLSNNLVRPLPACALEPPV